MPQLDIGDAAPDFTLTSHFGDAVTLSEILRSDVAIVTFHPASFTGG